MAHFKDKEKALLLRKEGMSYGQIKKELIISKSTLSGWLKDFPLSKERIKELRDCNEQRIERYRETMRRKKDIRLKEFYNQEKAKILPLSFRESYIAGLFLYWGEGGKTLSSARLQISNTDPAIIKFFISWLESIGVSKEKMKAQVHLYTDMVIEKEIGFWVKELGFKKAQFIKPYIKKSSSDRINHKGGFGHGTCNVTIGDARLSEKVLMGLKAISDSVLKSK